MESSLRRSSKLGREVLERAKRRSVDWTRARLSKTSNAKKNCEEDPDVHARLDHAFTEIRQYMSETTNQCRMFHSTDTVELSEREQTHVCRFHSPLAARTAGRLRAGAVSTKQVHFTGLREPEDFLIEVSPGTYVITAAAQDARPQTKVVRVNAGESTRLTFDL